MSDEDKPKTGFAANPKGINRRGRPLGSKNKLPTDPALKELLKKNAPEAVQMLIKLMRDSKKEEVQLKSAIKIIDMTYSIVLNDEKAGNPNLGEESTTTPQGDAPTEKLISLTIVPSS